MLRSLDGLGLVVYPLELFEGSALGLDAERYIMLAIMQRQEDDAQMWQDLPEEVPEDGLDDVPADEDENVSVANVAQRNGTAELVDEPEDSDDDARCGETLGAAVGIESLGRDDTLERRVGEGVNDVEQEVEGEGGLSI